MIKTELRLKELTTNDKASIVETISDYVIGRKDDGTPYYMPYLRDNAIDIALTLYAIDGIVFEDGDNIYDIYIKDEEIHALVKLFMNDNVEILSKIERHVDDVIEFKKNYLIHNNPIVINKILDVLETQKRSDDSRIQLANKENKILDQQIKSNDYELKVMDHMNPETVAKLNEKLASGEFNQKQLADAVLKSYMDSDLIKKTDKKNVVGIDKKKNTNSKSKKTTKTAKEEISKSNNK